MSATSTWPSGRLGGRRPRRLRRDVRGHLGVGWCRPAGAVGGQGAKATSCSVRDDWRPRHGGHAARGDLAMERTSRRTPPPRRPHGSAAPRRASTGCCATPPVAAWVRSATSCPGCRGDGRAGGGPSAGAPPVGQPASCSGSTRSTWRTRESSSPSLRPPRLLARLLPCVSTRSDERRCASGKSGSIPRDRRARHRLRGTRIVDMLVGDPLPRIC